MKKFRQLGFIDTRYHRVHSSSWVGLSTVQAIEKANGAPSVGLGIAQTKARREAVRADSVEAIRKTLVAAGITFLTDDGRNGAGIRARIRRRAQ